MPLSKEDVYYLQNNPGKLASFLNGIEAFVLNPASIAISPATRNVTLAAATAGTTVNITYQLKAGGVNVNLGNFTLAASVSDTVADAGVVPTISDTTPNMKNGFVAIKLTLPAGTYVAGETITVTLANYTAPDGRTVTGGTTVVTITA